MILPEGEISVHQEMIEKVVDFIESEGLPRPSMKQGDAEVAYRSLQRRICTSVYASNSDLKTISAALERDGTSFEYLPLWLDAKSLNASKVAIESVEKEAAAAREARRLQAEEERRLDAEKKAKAENEAGAVEAELQAKHGAVARALLVRFDEGLTQVVLDGQKSGVGARLAAEAATLFPNFHRWNAELETDFWTAKSLKTEIEDYGVSRWKDRSLDAIVVKVDIEIESSSRGERKTECLLLGAIVDDEFASYRDGFEAPCNKAAKLIDVWMPGHSFESRWRSR